MTFCFFELLTVVVSEIHTHLKGRVSVRVSVCEEAVSLSGSQLALIIYGTTFHVSQYHKPIIPGTPLCSIQWKFRCMNSLCIDQPGQMRRFHSCHLVPRIVIRSDLKFEPYRFVLPNASTSTILKSKKNPD